MVPPLDMGGLEADGGPSQGQPARRNSLTEMPLSAAEAGLQLSAVVGADGRLQAPPGTSRDASKREAGDDEAETPHYELASDERDELFAHAERSSGSDEPGLDDAARGPPGIITGGLGMSEYAGSRGTGRILGPNQIRDSGSNYGAPQRGTGRHGRQQSSTVHASHGGGPLSSRHGAGGYGEPAGRANQRHQRRDSVAASLLSSGILSHGGASQGGGANRFGADRSQFGRSSTASFMSDSRSVSKLLARSTTLKDKSRRADFASKYG